MVEEYCGISRQRKSIIIVRSSRYTQTPFLRTILAHTIDRVANKRKSYKSSYSNGLLHLGDVQLDM